MGATDKLKSCPFCGSDCIHVDVGIYNGKSHESVTIECEDCGASIWGATEEKAIDKWNRRTHE